MTFERQNIYTLGSDWSDTILWYARAVGALEARPIATKTSWRFLGAMHGIDPDLWQAFGYLQPGEPLPSPDDQAAFWKQCQHQSWYFLPWHRGYLIAFEAIVRDAVVQLGGPADWALPYWNYSLEGQNRLPAAFAADTLPDGSRNPLKVKQRYGPGGDGNIYVPPGRINLTALGMLDFTGPGAGGDVGFGGIATQFSHDGDTQGGLENQPHNVVHGQVGGRLPNTDPQDGRNYGLMSMPDTAALDPIFWLHHCNIDRLWEVWLRRDPSHVNTDSRDWLDGPSDRQFIMPGTDGSAGKLTPAEVADLSRLDYSYDDLTDPIPGPPARMLRLQNLGMAAPSAAPGEMETAVAGSRSTELVGANQEAVRLTAAGAKSDVRLQPNVRKTVQNSLMTASARAEPDRVFLNLENITGVNDAAALSVYVNLPDDADPEAHPERRAGVIGLFGVAKATRRDGERAGNGLSFVLEITDIVDQLHLTEGLDADALSVRIVPESDVQEDDQISIGRISIYRQGR